MGKININSVGRTSSDRLQKGTGISSKLADLIVEERVRNGSFSSFEDLRKRVKGVGPAKIEKLKDRGWVIKPRGDDAPAGGGGGGGGGAEGGGGPGLPAAPSTADRDAYDAACALAEAARAAQDALLLRRAAAAFKQVRAVESDAAKRALLSDMMADLEAQAVDAETAAPGGLRLDVAGMSAQTWRHRANRCLYTQLKKAEVVKLRPEVDHVWEMQLLDLANERAAEGKGMAARTRAVQQALAAIVNSTKNLNVTTHEVNQHKKGPFMTFQHRYRAGSGDTVFEDIVGASPAGRALRDAGHMARITGAVVAVHGELTAEAFRIAPANRAARLHAGSVVEELGRMLERMGIA